MANGTLQSLFREPKDRATDRTTFAQVISRLSSVKCEKVGYGQKSEKDTGKAA